MQTGGGKRKATTNDKTPASLKPFAPRIQLFFHLKKRIQLFLVKFMQRYCEYNKEKKYKVQHNTSHNTRSKKNIYNIIIQQNRFFFHKYKFPGMVSKLE